MSVFITNLNASLASLPFWIGLFSVGAFAYSRFNVSLPDTDELSPPLRPRSFTTAFRFWHAACTYFGIYALLYLALLIVGAIPDLRDFLAHTLALPADTKSDVQVGTPAWAALVATAVLPAMPVASGIDERLRIFLQDFASIPTKARMLAREMLLLVQPPEPPDCDDSASIETVVAAIKAHKARSEEVFEISSKLNDDTIVAPGVSRRYDRFFHAHQKMVDGFRDDFTATAEGYATLESARNVERKYRTEVRKVARFLMCGILQAETTELGARARLNSLGVKVPLIGIEFRPSLIVLNFTAIFLMTLVGSYVSASVYFALERPPGFTYFGLLETGTKIFFVWSIASILFYTIPVVFAAGATMYVLDRKATAVESDPASIATAIVLTFLGSSVVALFILLPTTFITEQVVKTGHALTFWELLPWVIPPAFIATTFMYMSSSWEGGRGWISDSFAYVLFHGFAAATGAIIAYLLWKATLAPSDIEGLPDRLFLYLVPLTAGAIGAGVGWVLARTRKEARAV